MAGDLQETCHFERPSNVVRVCLSELSLAQRLAGHLWSAEQVACRALAMGRRAAQVFEVGGHLFRVDRVLSARGATAEADAAFRESLAIWQQSHPYQELESFLDAYLAQQALWTGDPTRALAVAETAGRVVHDHPLALNSMQGSRLQGMAHLALGALDAAAERLHVALTAAWTHNHVEEALLTLVPLAELHRRRSEVEHAREVLDLVWEPAVRGPYWLCQADAPTVLARLEWEAGQSAEAIAAATRDCALAWCDGPPFAHHWGLTAARELLLAWGASCPVLPSLGGESDGNTNASCQPRLT
jgi:hypothetical protein